MKKRCYPVEEIVKENRDYDRSKVVWSEILKKVRESEFNFLMAACANVSGVWIEDDALVLLCDESVYSLLGKKENKEFISLKCKEEQLRLAFKVQKQTSTFEEDVRELQRLIGGTLKLVKEKKE